ncbi:MAG: hypothetical protein J0I06_25695 [Planctomycetes bacterium]|nr:hypothetical protein [Planctomycetota bacterium]
MSNTPAPPSPARRALAVAVGLFAVWQLVYIPAANLIDLVPRRTGSPLEPISDPLQRHGTFTTFEPLQTATDRAGAVLDFWSELSGQEQGWSLFAPGLPPYTVTPAVEFRFADGMSDTLLSPYEPADKLNPPLRAPLVNNRPFNVEAQFIYAVWYIPPEEVAGLYATPEEIAMLPEVYRALPEAARVWRGPVRAYLSWRLKAYREARPERPGPVEVILKHRYIPTPKPNEPRVWTRPVVERPYALWRPADDSYEVYDAVAKRFVPVGDKP